MGVYLQPKLKPNATLRLISVVDSSIDWTRSYPEIMADGDKSSEDMRKEEYRKTYDISKLGFHTANDASEAPTVFVFRHPKIAETKSEVLNAIGSDISGQKLGYLARKTWNTAFIGTASGTAGEVVEMIKSKNGLPVDFIQAISEQGILEELFQAFNSAMNEVVNRDSDLQKKF